MDMRRRFECSKKLHLSSKMAVGDSLLGGMISLVRSPVLDMIFLFFSGPEDLSDS